MSRYRLFVVVFLFSLVSCQSPEITLCSWNLKDFGNSKTDEDISFIARTINDFDIVAIQEVVAGDGGVEAVIRLHELLVGTGVDWGYSISEPTTSSAYKTERYAFFWKKDKVRMKGQTWLEMKYNQEIDREPFFMTFHIKGGQLTVVNFHAITKVKQPETEIKYFKFFPEEYSGLNLVFCGDFNLPQSHSVFNPLKAMGYKAALVGQKTSLRDRCLEDGCLASEFDNFFVDTAHFELIERGVIHFYEYFQDFNEARNVSDHVPVFIKLIMK